MSGAQIFLVLLITPILRFEIQRDQIAAIVVWLGAVPGGTPFVFRVVLHGVAFPRINNSVILAFDAR